ncbi:MAG: FAD-dependent oxidoreductase, partial [Bordetella sp.]|nr:FAD-dependent oxidoreductase [Bordetella sp.]
MSAPVAPVIVGAGPAGVRAAQALVRAGLRPIVIDEAARAGGQIYRQPPPGFTRGKPALYGAEHRKADALHRAMDALLPHVDYRPDTLVWNCEDGVLDLMCQGEADAVPFRQLVIATGATDRVLPFPGWLTPGVYTLGGAQVALKFQGCAIGKRVAFLGTGPLLYLVAYQYAKAGARVAAVLDTAATADRLRALPGMLAAPALLGRGLYYMAWLRAHGVPLHAGVRPVRVLGGQRVAGLRWRDAGGAEHELA